MKILVLDSYNEKGWKEAAIVARYKMVVFAPGP